MYIIIIKTKEECYRITETEHAPPPFDLQLIAREQAKCSQLLRLKEKENVKRKEVTEGLSLWHFKPRQGTTYQINVPTKFQVPPVEWYHEALKQPGKTRTRYTIDHHYAWPEYANDNRKIGDQVTEGPYRFKRIFRNGTGTILRGAYEENISIRIVFEDSDLTVPQ